MVGLFNKTNLMRGGRVKVVISDKCNLCERNKLFLCESCILLFVSIKRLSSIILIVFSFKRCDGE